METKAPEQDQGKSIDENIESFIPSNIQVLGMDEWNQTILWIKDNRRIWRVAKLREIDGCMLIQIAGQDCLKDSSIEPAQIKTAIAQVSRRHCFGPEDHLGQGIWKIPGYPGYLVLSGDRAIILRNSKKGIFSWEVESPVIGNKLLEFNDAEKWIDLDQLKKYIYEITPETTKNLWEKLKNYLSCWFPNLDTDYDVIAGMVLATSIQGILKFRPHIWITGATNTGKTALFTFLGRLWPYALKLENETSEAAIRQEIQCSCLPVLFDECESWHGRHSVIKLLRSSTRGGKIIKGTPSHKPVRFGLRHIFWLASVDTGLRKEVDKNRFIIIELKRSDKITIPENKELALFGLQLVAATLAMTKRIESLYTAIVNTDYAKKWGRFAESLALPTSIKTAFLNLNEEDNLKFLQEFLEDRKDILNELSEPDHADVLSSICSATIQAKIQDRETGDNIQKQCSVGNLICDGRGLDELNNHGIRMLNLKEIFLAPQVIQQKLLWNTQWKDVNIADILGRIPGAQRTRRRVAGCNCRGIIVSYSAFNFKDDN